MSTPHHTDGERDNTITGVRVAIVRDNQDPESLGRVKLEYPWRDADDESYWARIATNMTGEGYGTYFLPEVGDEVLVGFENGDIHEPIVVGSLWSGKRKPPEANADGRNDIRAITTRSGHRVEFDDNDTQGSVTIETTGGQTVELDDTAGGQSIKLADSSGNSVKLDAAKGEVSISATTKISLDAPTISLAADSKVEVSSKGKVDVSSDGQASVSSKQLTMESNGTMSINATGPLTIQGAIIQLN